ncbi:MAG TPA: hypothetical protein VIB60_02635 [Methylomirabilota bacterium]|jgi:hypothetical protein
MRRITLGVLVGIVAVLATPAQGQSLPPADHLVYALLPVTPDQARQVTALLREPGSVAVDLVEASGTILAAVPELPAALVHDVVTAPIRDWHLVRGLATDVIDLVARPPGEARGLFRNTVRALHRSRVFTITADAVRRVAHPTNRTARLAIVLTVRANGLPAEDGDLDRLLRAIHRDDPDLGPLAVGLVERLAQMYGRDAVRVLLTLP